MMRHILVEIAYAIPVEEMGEAIAEHRVFLQIGYGRGWILFSGPLNPRTGEIIVARAPTLQDLQHFFEEDVYWRRNLTRYRFFEFEPVQWQSFMENWVAGGRFEE